MPDPSADLTMLVPQILERGLRIAMTAVACEVEHLVDQAYREGELVGFARGYNVGAAMSRPGEGRRAA